MRVLFTADSQLGAGSDLANGAEYGPGSRFADQEAILDQIVEIADRNQCELVVVAGDVFEFTAPKPHHLLAFQSFVRRLRDNGASVLCILGNHDVKSAALPPALAIFGETGVAVALGPSLYPIGDVVVATLPWTPIARLVADRPADDRDSLNDIAAAALVESAHLLGARCRDEHPDKTAILVGHWAIAGASLPTGLPTNMLREPVLSCEGLAGAGFDLAAFGHIHKAQVVNESPPIFYTGTPAVCNWGETSDQHGVWIFDTAGALQFVELKDRLFITLDFDHDDPAGQIALSMDIGWDIPEGAAVRVRYAVDEEQARRIDQAAIRRSLMACGAAKVVFRPTIERVARARVETMDESLDETQSFELWLASQNGKVNVDPEALCALHGEFLEKEQNMSYTVSGTHQIYVQACCNCGIEFGIPDSFDDQRRDDGKSFYCPNGHSQSYVNTLAKRYKEEQERCARLNARLDQEKAARDAAERRASAARGQVTKIKRRVGRGICPCCNRSFAALAEHMKTEHPEYAESASE